MVALKEFLAMLLLSSITLLMQETNKAVNFFILT